MPEGDYVKKGIGASDPQTGSYRQQAHRKSTVTGLIYSADLKERGLSPTCFLKKLLKFCGCSKPRL